MAGPKEKQKQLRQTAPKFLALGWILFLLVLSSQFLVHSSEVRAASAPPIITYQGKILNSSNAAVTTTVSAKFVLYNSLTGGTALYTASGTLPTTSTISVTPTNGLFAVNLGDTGTNSLDPAIFQNNQSIYLEVTINGETLTPRKQITASPFAFNAKYLDGVAATSAASTSTYIPVSDSSGNFNFNNVTSTGLAITGSSTFATATFKERAKISSDGINAIFSNTVSGNAILKNILTHDLVSVGTGSGVSSGIVIQIESGTGGGLLGRDGNSNTFMALNWFAPNSATSTAYTFDTKNLINTSGAKLLSVKNQGAELFNIDFLGGLTTSGTLNVAATTTLLGKALIGTSTPQSTAYQVFIDAGTSTNPGLGVNGYIKASGFIAGTTTLDLAELYPISPACADTNSCPEPGDAVCVVANAQPATIEKCFTSYSQNAIGIISTNPGFTLGGLGDNNTRKVALAGRVPLNVKGPVKIGDRLATSEIPGVAQVATEPGPTIGIALEDVPTTGHATVLTLVNIGFSLDGQNAFPVTASAHTFLDTVAGWLRQLGVTIINGIVQAKELIAEKITGSMVVAREHLCVGQTCITEDQLKQILQQNQLGATSVSNSSGQAVAAPAPALATVFITTSISTTAASTSTATVDVSTLTPTTTTVADSTSTSIASPTPAPVDNSTPAPTPSPDPAPAPAPASTSTP